MIIRASKQSNKMLISLVNFRFNLFLQMMWTRLSKIVRATNLSAGIYRQISWKDISLHFLYWPIALNLSKLACIFPDCLKDANVTPSFKKEDPPDKKNYLPDSILPLLSKTIKRTDLQTIIKLYGKFFEFNTLWFSKGAQYPSYSSYSSYFIPGKKS